ncbi:unnamed protein product [Prunus armeniaca]
MKNEVVPDIATFDLKKKKKKKKVVFQDTTEDSVEKLAEKTENLAGCSIETKDSGDAVEDLNGVCLVAFGLIRWKRREPTIDTGDWRSQIQWLPNSRQGPSFLAFLS